MYIYTQYRINILVDKCYIFKNKIFKNKLNTFNCNIKVKQTQTKLFIYFVYHVIKIYAISKNREFYSIQNCHLILTDFFTEL